MKNLIYWIGAIIFILGCSTQKNTVKIESNDVETAEEDSVEYELVTFDSQFESWYKLHDSPSEYRSQQYYENWNQRYVSAWNYNTANPHKRWFFETIVGYDPTIDYGFELNHKLFYYFQYVENVLKIPIISGGPNVIHY
jgi:hypothetical protein